ncbi:MAG TPA: 3'(2'),5'-bisphosphate nucleotidase CysQ [Pseudolabrys sp.]|nr:3'(2'),5'-bisphosphate nucleotidase CysQ [Pseudolabrys sp.]
MSSSAITTAQAAEQLDVLTAIVARASAQINGISPATVVKRAKADHSPVTAADEASEEIMLEDLARALPGVPVISEESANSGHAHRHASFVIVDPLDGTREYLAGSDEFTVNLAIVSAGVPIVGIVAAPGRGQVWRGIVGIKAERLRLTPSGGDGAEPIRVRPWPEASQAVATVSRSHIDPATEAFVTALGPVARVPCGSAIKFCRVAEGAADVYPRLATTCEWDVAAGHALVVAAGGIVVTPEGADMAYGRAEAAFRVPAFVAWGDSRKAAKLGR